MATVAAVIPVKSDLYAEPVAAGLTVGGAKRGRTSRSFFVKRGVIAGPVASSLAVNTFVAARGAVLDVIESWC